MDGSGRVLPVRPGPGPPGPTAKASEGAVATAAPEFHFSAFTVVEDGAQQPGPVAEAVGGATESRTFLQHRVLGSPGASPGPLHPGSNGGPLDYASYYMPSDYYSLAKEQSLESQDSSTLSSPRSETLAPPGTKGSPGAPADSLFQFSIGKILEDEGGGGGRESPCELAGFYEGGSEPEPPSPPQLEDGSPPPDQHIRRWVTHGCSALAWPLGEGLSSHGDGGPA